jgi:hypothetical protein
MYHASHTVTVAVDDTESMEAIMTKLSTRIALVVVALAASPLFVVAMRALIATY